MRKMLGNLACQTHQLMLDVEGYSMLTGNSIISYRNRAGWRAGK
jgi:hypothetical protein